ncbi:MAG: hypothetical protein M5U12_17485 [Verrucomicrobia bacterium]|nr:hypothetical protein [Verrucomicrobiota bacterium]
MLNEKQGEGDLSAFVFTQMARYGGSNVPATRVIMIGLTNYVYSEDEDGFQIVCPGNQVAALCNALRAHFGSPALSTTNTSGVVSFVYSVSQTGLAINCGVDTAMVGGVRQQVTQFVAVQPRALR